MPCRPRRQLVVVAALVVLMLVPAAGQAHLRGNPFTQGPVYNDLPGREDAQTAFGPLNGSGPLIVRDRKGKRRNVWCNPSGRSLGPTPVVRPAAHVDAFYWVGRPGHSNGTCGDLPGSMRGPKASSWWPAWAVQLVENSRTALDFPVWRH